MKPADDALQRVCSESEATLCSPHAAEQGTCPRCSEEPQHQDLRTDLFMPPHRRDVNSVSCIEMKRGAERKCVSATFCPLMLPTGALCVTECDMSLCRTVTLRSCTTPSSCYCALSTVDDKSNITASSYTEKISWGG